MVRKHLIYRIVSTVALAAIAVTFIFMYVSGKGNLVTTSQDQAAAAFYFGRTAIDIKAADSAVPRVGSGTVAPYENLMLADQFYLGQTNQHGQLVYLETWVRIPEDEVALDTVVGGKPLREHSIAQHGGEISAHKPRVFMLSGSVWQEVSPQETEGETRFLRLRLLPEFEGSPAEPFAEVLSQRLDKKAYYTFDATGTLTGITVQMRETGFQSEKIPLAE